MYRVILIDDEEAATQTLKRSLEALPNIEVVGTYNNADEGIKAILELLPDIVFLDINMPLKDGFMVARVTEHVTYHLVFVTAYASHALPAFDTKVIDYLLKPVRPSRLIRCIEKIQLLEEKGAVSNKTSGITIYDGKRRHLLDPTDICFIESIGRYQQVHLTFSGQKKFRITSIITEETMVEFENKLDSTHFMRVHRSFIINLTSVFQLLRESRNMLVTLIGTDRTIPVSRAKSITLNEYFRLKHNR
ncbi:LytR/AlgR family response regulator transcription factor [Vibrio cyclitrophicus]|uniref:LytR/AlgR family response regulator transcription factor n=1 Tax=Vibrio cyclitrophicus TaxID=47951 RepID=UPI00029A097E|nr:LytTR family DNA-binding domain-containing protein [Vibrio cyclitrophicus]OEE21869.1 DNA-binding response regulator [Vibrio cyclitrophicus ZF14]